MRHLTILLTLLLTTLLQAKTPNILFFYVDDLGYTDLACQGSKYYQTPNIDRLKSQSLTFTNGYAGCANCAPSRAILMSGLYPSRHKVYTVPPATRGKATDRKLIPIETAINLDPKFTTLAQTLKSAGYNTCHTGKWHLSNDPLKYGFDKNIGGTHAGHPKSYFPPYKNKNLTDGPKGEYLTDRLAKNLGTWITQQKPETPFFAYMSFYSVHTPIQAPEDTTAKFKKRTPNKNHKNPKYAAMIYKMDQAVGHLLDTLEKQGIAEDTIIIFTSDNGPHGGVSNAKPLRGTKGMFYEGGIRVPFLIKYPGTTKPGTSTDTPVHQLDLYPTLAKIAGAKTPKILDGTDITPLLKSETIPARDLFWHFPCYLASYKGEGKGVVHTPGWRATPCSVIRSGDYKLIQYFDDNTTELFNLKNDPSERTDLTKTNPEKTKELLTKLTTWQKSTNADIPTKPNPKYKKP